MSKAKDTPVSYLSQKSIPPAERLIHALDVESIEMAKEWVERLGDIVRFYKIGLELFIADGYFQLIDWLIKLGKKVFVDLKFFDVPETVRAAVRSLSKRGGFFTTLHGHDT